LNISVAQKLFSCCVAVLLCTAAGAAIDDRGPSTPPAKTPTAVHQLDVAGRTRSYRLHLPPGFEQGKPVPLVIALHGAGGNGLIMEVLTGFDQVADANGFAVVYPDGELGMWRIWPGGRGAAKGKIADRIKAAREEAKEPGASASADVDFMKALIDELIAKQVADRRRVYVTGISNGGYFSSLLACDLGDRIAAIAPVAGTFAKFAASEAKPPRPVPVLYFHGTEDRIVGIDGVDRFTKRENSLSADDYVAWWVKQNSCRGEPRVDSLADAKSDGTKVERLTHAAGKAGGAPVVYYKIIGGGHTWPGGSFQPEGLLGKTCRDVDASRVIWEFFKDFELPEETKR
jgi:polyhydroxybutyrate depolymerase